MVIPAFNEAQHLPALLGSVDLARSEYAGGADRIEVIVSDNASTDGTVEIARGFGCVVVPERRRGPLRPPAIPGLGLPQARSWP